MTVASVTAQKIIVTKNLADLGAESITNRGEKTKVIVKALLTPTGAVITNPIDPQRYHTTTLAFSLCERNAMKKVTIEALRDRNHVMIRNQDHITTRVLVLTRGRGTKKVAIEAPLDRTDVTTANQKHVTDQVRLLMKGKETRKAIVEAPLGRTVMTIGNRSHSTTQD